MYIAVERHLLHLTPFSSSFAQLCYLLGCTGCHTRDVLGTVGAGSAWEAQATISDAEFMRQAGTWRRGHVQDGIKEAAKELSDGSWKAWNIPAHGWSSPMLDSPKLYGNLAFQMEGRTHHTSQTWGYIAIATSGRSQGRDGVGMGSFGKFQIDMSRWTSWAVSVARGYCAFTYERKVFVGRDDTY